MHFRCVHIRSFIRIFYVWKTERRAARRRSKWLLRRKNKLLVDHRAA